MFRKILVPTDGSVLSGKAAAAAIDIARHGGGTIVALTVIEPYPFAPISSSAYVGGSKAYRQRELEDAQYRLSKIRSAAQASGVPCETVVAEAATTPTEIVNAAARLGCDVIFMASHGRGGLAKMIVGSITQKVLAEASVPVMVYR